MEIRPATESDLPALERLWEDFTDEATFTPYPGSPFDPALVRDFVVLVADGNDGIEGTLYANVGDADFGFVFGVYVRPDARRRGVARTLMQTVARTLKAEGRGHVVLSVDTPNEPARRFYASLGFEDAARTLRAPVDAIVEPTK